MADITPLPNSLVRKYKANDPYYYEVDNLPLGQLEDNDNVLDGNIVAVNDDLTLRPTDAQVDAKIATQYTSITQPWVHTNFFDVNELFEGPKMSGLSPRTSTGVYTREEIEWVPNGSLQNGNLFTQFLRSYIVDPTNLPVDSTGNAWAWGSGILLNFFYDKAEIDTITFNVSRLDTDEVDAIDDTGSSSRVLVDSSQTAQLPTSTNPFVVQEQITNIKDSTESGGSITPTNKFIDADLLRSIKVQTIDAVPVSIAGQHQFPTLKTTWETENVSLDVDWPSIDWTDVKGVFMSVNYRNDEKNDFTAQLRYLPDVNDTTKYIHLNNFDGGNSITTLPTLIYVEIFSTMKSGTSIAIPFRQTISNATGAPFFRVIPIALVREKPLLV